MSEHGDWSCPKAGCELDVDGHDFGLAISHCMDMDEREAADVADRILDRVERSLLGDHDDLTGRSHEGG